MELATARLDIAKLYLASFNRVADTTGLDYWTTRYMNGETLSDIAQLFTGEPEYKAKYPAIMTEAEYVAAIYSNVFGRTADTAGQAHWESMLANGTATKATLMNWMVSSALNDDALRLANQAEFAVQSVLQHLDPVVTSAQLASITANAASVQTALTSSANGETFTLTVGIDQGASFTGGTGNDTFTSNYDGQANVPLDTLGALDVLDGGAGTDTLAITSETIAFVMKAATISNIENITIRAELGVTADVSGSNVTGLNSISVTKATTVNVDAATTTDVTVAGATGATIDVDGGKNISVTDATAANTIKVGAATVNAGTITVTDTDQSTGNIEIDGGTTVNVTASARTTGTIKVGDTTAANVATDMASGAITVTANEALTDGDAAAIITVEGGSSISITENITATAAAITTAATDTTTGDITGAAITATGGAATTSVTVNQTAAVDAIDYVAETSTDAAVTGVLGVVNGAVTIADKNAGTTSANTIATVSLTNAGATTIDSNALSTLNLAGKFTTVNATNTSTATTPAVTTVALGVAGVTSTGAVTIDSEVTTLNIATSVGATTLNDLQATGATTVAITGDKNFTATAQGFAATAAITNSGTGNVTLGTELAVGQTYTGAIGVDSIKIAATTKTIVMGAGDDTVTTSAATIGTDGSLAGGDGTDTIVMTAANAVTATADATAAASFADKMSGFEKLSLGAVAATGEVKLNNLDNINDISVAGVNAARALTLSGVTTGVNVRFADAVQTAATVTLGTNGSADVANIYTTTADNATTVSSLTLTGFETVNFTTADTDTDTDTAVTTVTTLIDADAKAITVTGSAGLNLGTFAGTALTSFNASGVTAGAVSYTTGALTAAATLTGGAGDDTLNAASSTKTVSISGGAGDDALTGSATASTLNGDAGNDTVTGGAGNDTISGGEGNDSITAAGGTDSITTGTGSDIVAYTAVANSTGATADTITDFVSGTDKLQFTIASAAGTASNINVGTFSSVSSFNDGLISLSGTNTAGHEVYGDSFYDTSAGKIYIDANGDGQINQNNDYTVVVGTVAAADLAFDITGSTAADTIVGGAGDDTITGNGGNDTITSGGGNDTITDYAASDVINLAGTEIIATAVVTAVTPQTSESYTSNAAGLVTFTADTETTATAAWTLAEKKAAVQADATLSAANKVSIFTDGSDSYVYYAGATTASTDDQFIKIEGGSSFKSITASGAADTGITLATAGLAGSVVSLAAFAGSEYSLHGTDFTHELFGLSHVSLAGYTEITLDVTTPAGAIDTALDNATFTLLNADTANASAPQYGATATARTVTGGATNDLILGGTGADTIDGAAGDDAILGGNGADSITAGAGDDIISGGAGDDTIVMAANLTTADVIDGGAGTDTLTFTDDLSGTTDLDHVTTVETITLGAAITSVTTVDALVASAATLTVDGALATTLTWDGSAETDGKFSVTGGTGADTITGGAGDDTIDGGAGADTIDVDAGTDTVVMTGASATDDAVFADADTSSSINTNDTFTGTFDLVTGLTSGDTLNLPGTLTSAALTGATGAATATHYGTVLGDYAAGVFTVDTVGGADTLVVYHDGVAGLDSVVLVGVTDTTGIVIG